MKIVLKMKFFLVKMVGISINVCGMYGVSIYVLLLSSLSQHHQKLTHQTNSNLSLAEKHLSETLSARFVLMTASILSHVWCGSRIALNMILLIPTAHDWHQQQLQLCLIDVSSPLCNWLLFWRHGATQPELSWAIQWKFSLQNSQESSKHWNALLLFDENASLWIFYQKKSFCIGPLFMNHEVLWSWISLVKGLFYQWTNDHI